MIPLNSTTLGVAIVVGQATAAGLAVWISFRTIHRFRTTDQRSLIWLAVGIVLLACVPTICRFVFGSIAVSPVLTSLTARLSELGGLCAILYAIYGHHRTA